MKFNYLLLLVYEKTDRMQCRNLSNVMSVPQITQPGNTHTLILILYLQHVSSLIKQFLYSSLRTEIFNFRYITLNSVPRSEQFMKAQTGKLRERMILTQDEVD